MAFPEIPGYTILLLLGRGGMGAVYRAREDRSGREVALKVLRRALVDDSEFLLRFKREAAALSSVRHPAIAAFIDSGEDGDFSWFSMEYVEGEPLAVRLADGPLPVGEACRVAAEVAEALSAAHSAGIIHRDVKPSNIMLSASGARLTDFGLARRRDGSGLTTSGRVMGSLPYMSPEQIRGEALTGACDIYALGAVLFEMLTGAAPFEASDDEALAMKVLTQPAPIVSRRRKDAPVGLDLLLIRMLAKEVDLRPASAADIAASLREFPQGRFQTAAIGEGGSDSRTSTAAARVAAVVVKLLPPFAAADRLAEATAEWARGRAQASGRAALLLEAALVRRRLAGLKRQARHFERLRDKRLKAASRGARGAEGAQIEAAQSARRFEREMRLEAEVFDARAAEFSATTAVEAKRLKSLEERARAAASKHPGRAHKEA